MIKPHELFLETLEQNSLQTKAQLKKLLRKTSTSIISEAMKYALLNGGKRLRAFLAIESSVMCGATKMQALQAAAAIECIHSYSLVHDDLPAMDNDDLRRGKPTVHKKWDDATAILVGDALQSLAFEILSSRLTHSKAEVKLNLIKSLASASGANGMVGGQAMDIAAETSVVPLNIEEIIKLQNLKTGALIIWSAEVGARLTEQSITPFTKYATSVGLAFQIHDDILDVIGETKNTGKALRKDVTAGKATFVSLFGLEGAKIKSKQLVLEACESIDEFGNKASMLRELAKFVINRTF
jgi:farnesyl diphosphate synthase